MSSYAWVITKDHTEPYPNEPVSASIEGLRGPRSCRLSVEEIKAHGIPFRLLGDDKDLLAEGWISMDPPVPKEQILNALPQGGFEPKDDYGEAALGATEILYMASDDHMAGFWEAL